MRMAEGVLAGALRCVLLTALLLGPRLWTVGMDECVLVRDVYTTTFANSETGNAVDIHVTSERSETYTKHTLDSQQLSTLCVQSPDCAKVLYKTYHLDVTGTTQFIVIPPLQSGTALLDYRYDKSLVLTENRKPLDKSCNGTMIVNSPQGVYMVCLTVTGFSLYKVNINHRSIEESSLTGTMLDISVHDTTKLSNFVHVDDEDNWICYADNSEIYCIDLVHHSHIRAGELTGCSLVSRLERVQDPFFWARCDSGSTKRFDILAVSEVTNVALAGSFPYICPVANVTLVVDLDSSYLTYGLDHTKQFQNFPLPGNSFRSESGICFEVQGITLLAFIDESEGLFIFNSSASNFTKLYDLQTCLSESHPCNQLLLFNNRYLHLRETHGIVLFDAHNNFEEVINQFVSAQLVAVFDLERSVVTPTTTVSLSGNTQTSIASSPHPTPTAEPTETASSDDNTVIIGGTTAGGALILAIIALVMACVLSATALYRRWIKGQDDSGPTENFIHGGDELIRTGPDNNTGSPLGFANMAAADPGELAPDSGHVAVSSRDPVQLASGSISTETSFTVQPDTPAGPLTSQTPPASPPSPPAVQVTPENTPQPAPLPSDREAPPRADPDGSPDTSQQLAELPINPTTTAEPSTNSQAPGAFVPGLCTPPSRVRSTYPQEETGTSSSNHSLLIPSAPSSTRISPAPSNTSSTAELITEDH